MMLKVKTENVTTLIFSVKMVITVDVYKGHAFVVDLQHVNCCVFIFKIGVIAISQIFIPQSWRISSYLFQSHIDHTRAIHSYQFSTVFSCFVGTCHTQCDRISCNDDGLFSWSLQISWRGLYDTKNIFPHLLAHGRKQRSLGGFQSPHLAFAICDSWVALFHHQSC